MGEANVSPMPDVSVITVMVTLRFGGTKLPKIKQKSDCIHHLVCLHCTAAAAAAAAAALTFSRRQCMASVVMFKF